MEAANGDEAVILSQAFEGKVDAAVVDMVMPRMWGHEIAARLLEFAPDLKVVYISGHSEEFMLGCGVLKSSDVFFAKPFYPSELADKIYEMLGVPNPLTKLCPDSGPDSGRPGDMTPSPNVVGPPTAASGDVAYGLGN
jgi:CheY-like chemotaxis protein